MQKKKRRRATAVVFNLDRSKVLLVKERKSSSYSLPGGGFEGREPAVAAAAREVVEETGLRIKSSTRAFDHEGQSQSHRVCIVQAGNEEIKLTDGELDYAVWWDGKERRKLLDSAYKILSHRDAGFLPRPSLLKRLLKKIVGK